MRRKIKIAISIIVVGVMIIGIMDYLGRIVRPTDADISLRAIYTFQEIPENTVEVIVYGSSHAWRGVNVMEMYRKYGIGAYNYGNNWQHINTTSLFLQDSLRTQSPQIAIIETFLVNGVLTDTDINGEIYYTKGLEESKEKMEYLKQCFGYDIERWLSYYIPICGYHDNWINLNKASFNYKDINTVSLLYTNMGFMDTQSITPVTINDMDTFEQKELNGMALSVLDKIVQTCAENDIEIIFYTAPWEGEFAYYDAMEKYAAENGCAYINFFEKLDEAKIDCDTDFCDSGHLNNRGAIKTADYLGNFIVENYDVTDMRLVKENIWEKNLIDASMAE